jgi:ADP-ribose diphosphatase
MSQQNNKPAILRRELVAQSRLFKVESLHLKFSNGNERIYERMRGNGRGAVMIVPVTGDRELLLIREYAAGTHSYELGFPKGLIDPGETPMEAANRELMEEVGHGAESWRHLIDLQLAPSYFGSSMTVLMAYDLYKEERQGDEPEPLEVVTWPVGQIDTLLNQVDFREARSVAALLVAQKVLNGPEGELS